MIIDKIIKDFDKNIVVDKKRKDILLQDNKEKYISRSRKKKK